MCRNCKGRDSLFVRFVKWLSNRYLPSDLWVATICRQYKNGRHTRRVLGVFTDHLSAAEASQAERHRLGQSYHSMDVIHYPFALRR